MIFLKRQCLCYPSDWQAPSSRAEKRPPPERPGSAPPAGNAAHPMYRSPGFQGSRDGTEGWGGGADSAGVRAAIARSGFTFLG